VLSGTLGEREEEAMIARRKSKSAKIDHPLVGRTVTFRNRFWKVVSAHRADTGSSPWLTLKRGLGLETTAKAHEVKEMFD